jgi:hypothetical protein
MRVKFTERIKYGVIIFVFTVFVLTVFGKYAPALFLIASPVDGVGDPPIPWGLP